MRSKESDNNFVSLFYVNNPVDDSPPLVAVLKNFVEGGRSEKLTLESTACRLDLTSDRVWKCRDDKPLLKASGLVTDHTLSTLRLPTTTTPDSI